MHGATAPRGKAVSGIAGLAVWATLKKPNNKNPPLRMVSFYQAVFNVTISNVNVSNAMQILRLDPQRMHQDFRVQEIIRIGILTVFIHRIFIARILMCFINQKICQAISLVEFQQ